jgi:hypothetical protein
MPEDPWVDRWNHKKIKDMFSEIGHSLLYETFYGWASEWIHLGPRALFRAMEPGTSGLREFSEDDQLAATWSLQTGCTALLECLGLFDHHFALGQRQRLQQQADVIMRIHVDAEKAVDQLD